MAGGVVRDAVVADAEACAAIYAPYVAETAISFELEPPTPSQLAQRIAAAQRTHAWLVLDADGVVNGYAYAGPYKERAAYRWSCEVSVYVDLNRRRAGAGRALYEALFERLAQRGYRTAIAGMTLPNPASEGLHRAVGFEPVGVYRGVGYKHGRWHDVARLQRPLEDLDDPPPEPR
ncbi:GNAT family N-acetyltransferase [uncultured Jatrophihabitans sp.]|uniref:GNAT family N-acetyltransferase n=1 Tax=uncultured Jatrophihabitans sp. TaxID=1610747 RepID=UPI0035CBD58F